MYWAYQAPPLAARELLYIVGQKKLEGKTIYGYPSVSNQWAQRHFALEKVTTKLVRSKNLFPSCDRVEVLQNNIRVTHLMTTDIGGWIPDSIFNGLFGKALRKAYVKEANTFRQYLLSAP